MYSSIKQKYRSLSFLKPAILCCAVLFVSILMGSRSAHADTDQQPFRMGVYLYEYQLARVAEEQGKDYLVFLEEHLRILRDHGVNAVYLGGTSRERFGKHLELFDAYDISVIPQLDFAYYRGTWDDKAIERNAQVAADFINRYADHPRVLAFSVREEIPHSQVNGLARYYAAILARAPKAKLQTIHNNLGAATDQPVPDPTIFGTDRYGFWWEYSGGGYLASPAFALNWTRKEADRYYWQAARRGADYMFVVTQGGQFTPASANRYAGDGPIKYPKTEAEQTKLRERLRTFAKDGRMGWKQFSTPEGDRYNVWKYYRLPVNCMRALAWTAVLQGAKSFYIYSYSPPGEKQLNTDFASAAAEEEPATWVTWFSLAGRPGMPNPQFDEFAEVAKEIRVYENIITRMQRLPDSLVECREKNVFSSAFTLPGIQGQVIVIHNANVGTWPGDNRVMFRDDDPIAIDDEGNLVGYEPLTHSMTIHIAPSEEATEQSKIYDIRSGQELGRDDEGYKVEVMPGSGVLLFLGSSEDAEAVRGLIKK